MKNKDVLKLLTKEELIKLIIEYQMPAFVDYVRHRIINDLKQEMDIIGDKQSRIDLIDRKTLKGHKEYADLEEEYQKKLKLFNDLCGIKG